MKRILFIGFALIIGASSCKKRQLNRSTDTFEDTSLAEIGFNDALNVTESAISDSSLNKSANGFSSVYGSCAIVTITPPVGDPTFPKTIEIDFGTGCTDAFGVERKGKVTATITDKYRNIGSVTTLNTINYEVKGYKVVGTKTVTNAGRNTAGNLYYTIDITNGEITHPNGDVMTYESSREREWIGGESTIFNPFDDEYSITGTANGINRNGRNYTQSITSPLIVQLNCRWVKQGTIEIQPEDLKLRTVDFGNGICDNDATVAIGKKTYNIQMK